MTEVAIRQSGTVSMIQETAQDLQAAHRIATALVSTQFAPAHFRGKPDDGAAAIMYGAAIGLDPLAAMQNIYVIGGKPALYARTMVALVMSHGHSLWTEETSDESVTVCGQRKGSDHVEKVTWTLARARKAGYTNNKKYESDPQAMLYARASGDVARRIAPDALLGMAYTVEELEASGVQPEPEQPRTSGAARLAAAVAATPQEPAQQPVKATSERAEAPVPETQPETAEDGQAAIDWPEVKAPGGGS